jgi:two-component system, NarL family, sensor histidine kinase DesK
MSFRLVPPDREVAWTPYVFLLYLAFVFIDPIANHASLRQWAICIAFTLLFLPFYFLGYWVKGRTGLLVVSAIATIGYAAVPFIGFGGVAFLIYAAAFLGFMFETADGFKILAAMLLLFSLECYLLHALGSPLLIGNVLIGIIGAVNLHFGQRKRTYEKLRLAQAEVEHLVKLAERERIARGLHDVLGHMLSLIILKSELASQLIDRDIEKARKEILDVEQTAREALADVRQTIGGYRSATIQDEFARARNALETAGLTVDCSAAEIKLSPAQETVMALATREAVTNIVRHAKARLCRLRLELDGPWARLEIQDDGLGGAQFEGNGIRGMRERVEALRGRLERDTAVGTKLTITLPLA